MSLSPKDDLEGQGEVRIFDETLQQLVAQWSGPETPWDPSVAIPMFFDRDHIYTISTFAYGIGPVKSAGIEISALPEPSSMMCFTIGLLAIRWRRRTNAYHRLERALTPV